MANPRTEIESDLAIHPGEFLAEEIQARSLSQRELARAMGRPPQAINEIIRGKKAITAETAIQLERVLGGSAQFWVNLQGIYDLVKAREAERASGA